MNKIIISLGSYLEGLLNMASSLSKNIGPSYVKVDCYIKEDFKEQLSKYYKVPIDKINLIKTNETLEYALSNWFGNETKIIESITYWFNLKVKGAKVIYHSEEELKNILDNKQMDFYCLDDLFFVESKEYIFVFQLGNNE